MKKSILAVVTFTLLSACASRPASIAPVSVSALEYKGMSCAETKSTLDQKRATLAAAEQRQRQAATGDAVGVFLLLIPVGTVLGADQEGVIAQSKGEVMALERAIPMNCGDR